MALLCSKVQKHINRISSSSDSHIPKNPTIGRKISYYRYFIATFIINILRVPYNAMVVAYEEMSFFAVVSIIETGLKLGVVFLLPVINVDKLSLYGGLMFIVPLLSTLMYKVYCNKKFENSKGANDKGKAAPASKDKILPDFPFPVVVSNMVCRFMVNGPSRYLGGLLAIISLAAGPN